MPRVTPVCSITNGVLTDPPPNWPNETEQLSKQATVAVATNARRHCNTDCDDCNMAILLSNGVNSNPRRIVPETNLLFIKVI